MSMKQNGLAKLAEECGELLQVTGKMVQYPELQSNAVNPHPDGTILRERLQEEMGDVLAAVMFVIVKLELDMQKVIARREQKRALFHQWDTEP